MTDTNDNNNNNNGNNNSDSFIPKAVTDFIFDLYDSVTLSQIHHEQNKLYTITFPELCNVYYPNSTWPSPASIASECSGDPLFLVIYRELIHRYYFNNTNLPSNIRPTLTDRMEGWDVYKELFDEILDFYDSNNNSNSSQNEFYLLPLWVFEILFEFIYQFQGYCQIKSAVYATAKKNHLINEYGNRIVTSSMNNNVVVGSGSGSNTTTTTDTTTTTNNNNNTKHVNLLENLSIFEQNTDAWDVSIVFQYLYRFIQMAGLLQNHSNDNTTITTTTTSNKTIPVVHLYFGIFSCICQSRLECLLGDYVGCLLALDPLEQSSSKMMMIIKDDETWTIPEMIHHVVAARVSLVYHVGISYIQLRRYYDAYTILMNGTSLLQRGFKMGTIRTDLFNKQYDRMISLLIIVLQICPGITKNNHSTSSSSSTLVVLDDASPQYDESMIRTLREKHSSSKIETITASSTNMNSTTTNNNNSTSNNNNTSNTSSSSNSSPTNYDEWFASPKFITSHPIMIGGSLFHKQQIDLFHTTNMKFFIAHGTMLRSFLKLYTSIPIHKLASFHDIPLVKDFLPILLTYKARLQHQIQRVRITSSSSDPTTGATTTASSLYSTGARSIDVNRNNSSNISIVNTIQDDMHYYIQNDTVFINEAEEQRHLESYLCTQMKQLHTIQQKIIQLDTKI